VQGGVAWRGELNLGDVKAKPLPEISRPRTSSALSTSGSFSKPAMAGLFSSLAVLGLLRRCSNCGGRPPDVRGARGSAPASPAPAPALALALVPAPSVAARAALRFLSRAAC
jgi:hypothetical protein